MQEGILKKKNQQTTDFGHIFTQIIRPAYKSRHFTVPNRLSRIAGGYLVYKFGPNRMQEGILKRKNQQTTGFSHISIQNIRPAFGKGLF